jgi:NADP-dependent 3-hydroxy acid dehydrogenase YdfG
MHELEDKTAIVTGAGSGMGRETALLLAAAGATVYLVGRREDRLEETRAAVPAGTGAAHVVALDITRPEAAEELVGRVLEERGSVDVLVNSAGSSSEILNPLWITPEAWQQVIDVNLNAVFYLTQALLPHMLRREEGTVVTLSSLAAATPNLLGGAAYGAAKAAVRNYMTFLHTTFRNQGIRAITVLPGETDTPILENRARRPEPAERANMVRPEDVARAVEAAVLMPARTVLQEIVVAPTRQRDISADLEISRRLGDPSERAPQSN